HRQGLIDLLSALNAHERGDSALTAGGGPPGGGAGDGVALGVGGDETGDRIDLLPGRHDRLCAGDRGTDVDRPVLGRDMAGGQLVHRGERRHGRVVETLHAVVALLAQEPGEVVVSVEDVIGHGSAPSSRVPGGGQRCSAGRGWVSWVADGVPREAGHGRCVAGSRSRAGVHGHHPIPDMICAVHSPRNVPANAPMSAKSTPTGTSCRLNAPATTGAEAIPPMFAVLATAMLNSSVFVSLA